MHAVISRRPVSILAKMNGVRAGGMELYEESPHPSFMMSMQEAVEDGGVARVLLLIRLHVAIP